MKGIVFKRDDVVWLYYRRNVYDLSDYDGLYETFPETKAEVVEVDENEVTQSFTLSSLCTGEIGYAPNQTNPVPLPIHEVVKKAMDGECTEDGPPFHELLEDFIRVSTEQTCHCGQPMHQHDQSHDPRAMGQYMGE